MVKKISAMFNNLSLSNENGRFLADKSYAYDTVYFMSLYIINNLSEDLYFDKANEKETYNNYTSDIFLLKANTSGLPNYINETLNILEFAGIIKKDYAGYFRVFNYDILKFVSDRMENSYIFLYLLVYYTFYNDGILDKYQQFLDGSDMDIKKQILNEIYRDFKKMSDSIVGTNTNWSKQLVKYSLIVLNFLNEDKLITRTLNIKDENVSYEDIAINIAGTRTSDLYRKKINDYVYNFDIGYVQDKLKDYILKDVIFQEPQNLKEIFEAEKIARLKLDILYASEVKKSFDQNSKPVDYSKYDREPKMMVINEEANQFMDTTIKVRNSSVQYTFRKNLLENLSKECVICGYSIPSILVAGHIVPYSKCDSVHDAVNINNGLLFCPNHDRLFEGGKYLTIDSETGKIIVNNNLLSYPEINKIKDKYIDKALLNDERKKYLKTHNEYFETQNSE